MSKFHHPYHFIPSKKGSRKQDISAKSFQDSDLAVLDHISHHRYASKTSDDKQVFSGRVVCKLNNKTPLVLGGERKPYSKDMKNYEQFKDTNRVLPFELNGQPAIPASTLRGMVTSLAEAASDSALRVLDSDYVLSYRQKMPGLGALGMIVTRKDEEGNTSYSMRPLALPPIQKRGRDLKVQQKWADIFPEPDIEETPVANLKVYIHGYNRGRVDNRSFLSRVNPKSYSADNKEYWYLPLPAGAYIDENYNLDADDRNFLRYDRREKFVLGQKSNIQNDEPFDQATYNKLPDDNKQKYTRGILRVLGIDGRGNDIPYTKKHEVFIPYPEWMENEESWPLVDIPTNVVETYERLADQRAATTESNPKNAQVPFHPKGRNRDKSESGKRSSLRLRDGDIVYFDVEFSNEHERYEVTDLSFSSIWRGVPKDGGRVKNFLDAERLPYTTKRETLSIAEQLFGFVNTDDKGKSSSKDGSNSLKSRVRFSFATLAHSVTEPYEADGLMKILDSPKPPSPAFYFKSRDNDAYIDKAQLQSSKHEIQGRKVYLHHKDGQEDNWKQWQTKKETENLKQKSWVKPLKKNHDFYFHIDFYNLSSLELGLLLYALEPDNDFHHKLGMGKSLGFGTVKNQVQGIFFIDRQKRYETIPQLKGTLQRYHGFSGNSQELPDSYKNERNASQGEGYPSIEVLRNEFVAEMDADIKQAITLLGNPDNSEHPVQTPQILGTDDFESESFKWFVANDIGSGSKRNNNQIPAAKQRLEPLNKDSEKLPHLERLRFNK